MEKYHSVLCTLYSFDYFNYNINVVPFEFAISGVGYSFCFWHFGQQNVIVCVCFFSSPFSLAKEFRIIYVFWCDAI